jgi:hypothetical protein
VKEAGKHFSVHLRALQVNVIKRLVEMAYSQRYSNEEYLLEQCDDFHIYLEEITEVAKQCCAT